MLDLTVNAGGSNIYNSGILTAHRNMSLTSSSLNNSNIIQTVRGLTSNQTGTFDNSHSIFGGSISISATGGITNQSQIVSKNNLTLSSSSDVVNDGGRIAALDAGSTLKIRAKNLKNSRAFTLNKIDPTRFNLRRNFGAPIDLTHGYRIELRPFMWDTAYIKFREGPPHNRREVGYSNNSQVSNVYNDVTTTDHQYNDSATVSDKHNNIYSGNKLTITVDDKINNSLGSISARGDIRLSGRELNNQDLVLNKTIIRHEKQDYHWTFTRKTGAVHPHSQVTHYASILPPAEHSRTPSIIKAVGTLSGNLSGRVTVGSSESGGHKSVSAPSEVIGAAATRRSVSAPTVDSPAAITTKYAPAISRAANQTMSSASMSATKFVTPTIPKKVGGVTIPTSKLRHFATRASRPAHTIPSAVPPSTVSLADLDSEVLDAINTIKASVQRPERPGKRYIKETSPVFTEFEQYFSTQNFIQRLTNYNPDTEPVHYGDAFNQMQLVQQQLVDLTGISTLDEIDPVATMQKLYESGERLGRSLELEPGVTLSEAAVDQLQDDIVWPEIVNIDGEDILVPRLYLAKNKNHTKVGSGIHAKNIALTAAEIDNHTAISASGSIALTATGGDVRNLGGTIRSGGSMLIVANDDIINEHGSITAGGDAVLVGGGDIVNTHGAIEARGKFGAQRTQYRQPNSGYNSYRR